jgi:acyl carrier protein
MNDHLDDVVRRAIARHLGVTPGAIGPLDHLDRDLHLQPLDIVLIVLAIEDAEKLVLPIADLVTITTVSGLTRLVRRASVSAQHAYRPAFIPIYRHRHSRRNRRFLRRYQEA